MGDRKTVAVIGGGLSGVCELAHLVDLLPNGAPANLLFMTEEKALGGLAYGKAEPWHLLNALPGMMSVFDENHVSEISPDPKNDFLLFLRERYNPTHGTHYSARSYVPRLVYGAYLEDVFERTQKVAQTKGIRIERVLGKVKGIKPKDSPTTGWKRFTRQGRQKALEISREGLSFSHTVQGAVLTTGHGEAREFRMFAGLGGPYSESLPPDVNDPWNERQKQILRDDIGPEESVLISGSGNTAVDVLMTLLQPRKEKLQTIKTIAEECGLSLPMFATLPYCKDIAIGQHHYTFAQFKDSNPKLKEAYRLWNEIGVIRCISRHGYTPQPIPEPRKVTPGKKYTPISRHIQNKLQVETDPATQKPVAVSMNGIRLTPQDFINMNADSYYYYGTEHHAYDRFRDAYIADCVEQQYSHQEIASGYDQVMKVLVGVMPPNFVQSFVKNESSFWATHHAGIPPENYNLLLLGMGLGKIIFQPAKGVDHIYPSDSPKDERKEVVIDTQVGSGPQRRTYTLTYPMEDGFIPLGGKRSPTHVTLTSYRSFVVLDDQIAISSELWDDRFKVHRVINATGNDASTIIRQPVYQEMIRNGLAVPYLTGESNERPNKGIATRENMEVVSRHIPEGTFLFAFGPIRTYQRLMEQGKLHAGNMVTTLRREASLSAQGVVQKLGLSKERGESPSPRNTYREPSDGRQM